MISVWYILVISFEDPSILINSEDLSSYWIVPVNHKTNVDQNGQAIILSNLIKENWRKSCLGKFATVHYFSGRYEEACNSFASESITWRLISPQLPNFTDKSPVGNANHSHEIMNNLSTFHFGRKIFIDSILSNFCRHISNICLCCLPYVIWQRTQANIPNVPTKVGQETIDKDYDMIWAQRLHLFLRSYGYVRS